MALNMNSMGIPGGFRGNAGFSGKIWRWGGFERFGASKGFCGNNQCCEAPFATPTQAAVGTCCSKGTPPLGAEYLRATLDNLAQTNVATRASYSLKSGCITIVGPDFLSGILA